MKTILGRKILEYKGIKYKVTKADKENREVEFSGMFKPRKKVVIPPSVMVDGIGYSVTGIGKINIQSKMLKSVGKKAFKGIKANITITVPKKKYAAYKKLLKGIGKQVRFKKS